MPHTGHRSGDGVPFELGDRAVASASQVRTAPRQSAAESASVPLTRVDIRLARDADVVELVPRYEWLFAPPGSRPPAWDPNAAEGRLHEVIRSDRSDAIVADDHGSIAGFCTIYLDILSVRFGQRAWVEDLAVAPDRRSLGIGKSVLDAAKTWARERGASHLELDSALARQDAHRFYDREGAAGRSFSFHWSLYSERPVT